MEIDKYLNKTLISKEGLMFRLYTSSDGSIGNTIRKDLYSDTYYILPDFVIAQCEIIDNTATISIY